jgi:hypothetical protein
MSLPVESVENMNELVSPLRVRVVSPYATAPVELQASILWSSMAPPKVVPFQTIKELKFEVLRYSQELFGISMNVALDSNPLGDPQVYFIFSGRILSKDQDSIGETIGLHLIHPNDLVEPNQEQLITVHAIFRGYTSFVTQPKATSTTPLPSSPSVHVATPSPAMPMHFSSPMGGNNSVASSSVRPLVFHPESIGYSRSLANAAEGMRSALPPSTETTLTVPSASSYLEQHDHLSELNPLVASPTCEPKEAEHDLDGPLEAYFANYHNFVANYYQQYYAHQYALLSILQESNQTHSHSSLYPRNHPFTGHNEARNQQPGTHFQSSQQGQSQQQPPTQAQSQAEVPQPAAQPAVQRRLFVIPLTAILYLAFKWSFVLYLLTRHSTWRQTIISGAFAFLVFLGQLGMINWGYVQRRIWSAIGSLVVVNPANNLPNPTLENNEETTRSMRSRTLSAMESMKCMLSSMFIAMLPGSHPLDPATSAAEHLAAAEEVEAAAANAPGMLG